MAMNLKCVRLKFTTFNLPDAIMKLSERNFLGNKCMASELGQVNGHESQECEARIRHVQLAGHRTRETFEARPNWDK